MSRLLTDSGKLGLLHLNDHPLRGREVNIGAVLLPTTSKDDFTSVLDAAGDTGVARSREGVCVCVGKEEPTWAAALPQKRFGSAPGG